MADLASSISSRDEYAELARRHEPQVLRHALRLCNGNLDWAKDLTQDALIAGYSLSRHGKLDYRGNVKAWFLRVVTTRFINEFRRNKKWTNDQDVEKLDQIPAYTEAVSTDLVCEDPFVSGMFDEPLERALRALPENQRLCVLLIDVEEMSYEEAAELLQAPVGTVRSRLARGRLRLYSLLMPYAKSKGIV
jgi:RNA polymerase sigma-70 factor (ECF subfamily)